jgi:hypothetical protein
LTLEAALANDTPGLKQRAEWQCEQIARETLAGEERLQEKPGSMSRLPSILATQPPFQRIGMRDAHSIMPSFTALARDVFVPDEYVHSVATFNRTPETLKALYENRNHFERCIQ